MKRIHYKRTRQSTVVGLQSMAFTFKKEYDNAIKKYNKVIRLVENYHNLNEISARSANLLSNIYNNLDYTTGMFYQGIIFLNKKDYKNAASAL